MVALAGLWSCPGIVRWISQVFDLIFVKGGWGGASRIEWLWTDFIFCHGSAAESLSTLDFDNKRLETEDGTKLNALKFDYK